MDIQEPKSSRASRQSLKLILRAVAGSCCCFAITGGAIAQDVKGEPVPAGRNWFKCSADHKPPERYYPKQAQRSSVEGVAKIQCRIQPDGVPSECIWLTEPAPDLGFGTTAEHLGCMFKLRPLPGAAGGELPIVQIPIRFKLPH